MKSIIQEASSIAKAIEMGWVKAGKPQDFSVKIFQEAQKNFIGMTTMPAKIAILFNDHPEIQRTQSKQQPQAKTRAPREAQEERPAKPQPKLVERRESKQTEANTQTRQPRELKKPTPAPEVEEGKKSASPWTDELHEAAEDWLKESLSLLGLSNIQFSTSVNRQLLKINFSGPLVDDREREKYLLRSIAFLLMQTLRRQFKRSLRNARIALITSK